MRAVGSDLLPLLLLKPESFGCRAQLPVFVTAMWASRRMALAPWPGLEAGGALWFPDLTVPALDLASQTAQVSRQQTMK